MKILNAIVIDDEPLAINVLRNYVDQINELRLEGTFSNAIEAQSYLQHHEVDIIFLDINMPVLDGIGFLESMKIEPFVIMTTAHENYALRSFELEVFDYLVKPIPFSRFLKSVNRILKITENSEELNATNTKERGHIFVKVDKKKLQKIFLDEIAVVESLKDYIRIITVNENYIVHRTLGGFTAELPTNKFIRIHRSYTVSIEKINVVEGNSLEVLGVRYTIGRSYLANAKKIILNDSSDN